MPPWIVVHTTTDRARAEMIKGALEAEGIAVVLVDKGSSAYPLLGNVDVLVDREQLLLAKHLIDRSYAP
ncbi:MAG: DUF2007 domain-containing protein [Flavobacteriales bacterium]|nr:DUF2007 domain-containing protein [Flavobacteriales bacterium]